MHSKAVVNLLGLLVNSRVVTDHRQFNLSY
jgi:hypothetical protein